MAFMHRIIALWVVPRSASVAFEWKMRQRGDQGCLDEPFGEAWYQGEEPLWHRWKLGDRTKPRLTLESVWDNLRRRAASGSVLIKGFPHFISHIWMSGFLSHCKRAFLIRVPAKTIPSIHGKWPEFREGEVGFPEGRAPFNLLHAPQGVPPPVIDRDDLLESPAEMTAAFCDAAGIHFVKEALHWKPGVDPWIHSWWDGGPFHHNLARSSGLSWQQRRSIEIAAAPERVRQVHHRMKPHCDYLHSSRICSGGNA